MSFTKTNGKEYIRFRHINISKLDSTEVSSEFFSDMERIINKIKKKCVEFDGYDIHISLRGKIIDNPCENAEALYEVFEADPYKISSELDLEEIIKYIKDNKVDFYPYIQNFFKAFITINHDHLPFEFEEEYEVDINDLDNVSIDRLCDIANNELDWMGLGWEFAPIDFKNERIWCQKKID